MNTQDLSDLEYLEKRLNQRMPVEFSEMPEHHVRHFRIYVVELMASETEQYDQLFESLAMMMMKYVPNFILHAMIPKYIEPQIAARISAKLSIKQVVGVTGGLPTAYIGEAAIHMDAQQAAAVLAGLKKKLAAEVVEYMATRHPVNALDILAHASGDIQAIAARQRPILELECGVLAPSRQAVFERLRTMA